MTVAHLTICSISMIKHMRERAIDAIIRVLRAAANEAHDRGRASIGDLFKGSMIKGGDDERPLRAMVGVLGLTDTRCGVAAVTAACIGAFNGARMRQTLRAWGVEDRQRRDTIVMDIRRPLLRWAFDASEATKNT